MNSSLSTLCDALKHIFAQLKPRSHPVSFLILTGRDNQGKSTLMRQSNCDHHPIDAEGAHIYTNQHGVIVELGESWLNQEEHRLENTLKQLNSVHRLIKINGILLCVDVNELMMANHGDIKDLIKAHAKLLERFGVCLNYQLDASVVLTKLDLMAGFCDFFQSEHPLDLAKPLGFSIYEPMQSHKTIELFKTKFDQLVQQLGQQVTHKVHPIRSNVKRTFIREFPLQVASLRHLILPLMGSISSKFFRLQALYLTSGEQGGIIQDRLNKKIQHEFALVVQDQFHQSTNYRSYFIEGALFAFQTTTQKQLPRTHPKQFRMTLALSSASLIAVSWIIYQYVSSVSVLNHVGNELHVIRKLNNHYQSDAAMYHLSHASTTLESLAGNTINLPMVKTLQARLQYNTNQHLTHNFLPQIVGDLEQAISESNGSPISRYQALKIYLMLVDKTHYNETDILAWFTKHWQSNPSQINKKLKLLTQVLHNKAQPITINQNVVIDARNYLNALPASYLYYSLAKAQFNSQTIPIDISGFNLASAFIPMYVTHTGFQQTITQLPSLIMHFNQDNWVLARQDLSALPKILEEAYCNDYVTWWQHFLTHTHPLRIDNYEDAHKLTMTLRQTHSMSQLLQLIQTQTRPQTGQNAALFNQAIANKFSDLNLLSASNFKSLYATLAELERFTQTLALVSDEGKTAFYLAKARFQGDKLANPISQLYTQSQQFPEPLLSWTTQIANDTWYTLINSSRQYLNQVWQQAIYKDYQESIAHRYPLETKQSKEIALKDFNRFFATHGSLNRFVEEYIKPFLDTSTAQWQRKELDHYVLPISDDTINELMRANVITHMFFPDNQENSHIAFSLQKISLDPVVSQLQLSLGHTELKDSQTSDNITEFQWPQSNARLVLRSIEGKHFELDEIGTWAFFKLLQKVNVLVDEQDSANLQILFEINGNSGRYLLKAQNQVNPFIPGILDEFTLLEKIV